MSAQLSTPARLAPGTLRIIPLGGLGDVGRNMACFEIDGEILLVDCGVLFPEDDHPGVDLILPGLDYLADRLDDIKDAHQTGAHVGIGNINDRMRTVFGAEYALVVETAPNAGTKVILKVPKFARNVLPNLNLVPHAADEPMTNEQPAIRA